METEGPRECCKAMDSQNSKGSDCRLDAVTKPRDGSKQLAEASLAGDLQTGAERSSWKEGAEGRGQRAEGRGQREGERTLHYSGYIASGPGHLGSRQLLLLPEAHYCCLWDNCSPAP